MGGQRAVQMLSPKDAVTVCFTFIIGMLGICAFAAPGATEETARWPWQRNNNGINDRANSAPEFEISNTLPAPYNLVAIASDGAVCLQWERPRAYTLGWGGLSQEPITSYSVEVQPEGLPPGNARLASKRLFMVPQDSPTESRVTGLSNGYTYSFTVTAEVGRG